MLFQDVNSSVQLLVLSVEHRVLFVEVVELAGLLVIVALYTTPKWLLDIHRHLKRHLDRDLEGVGGVFVEGRVRKIIGVGFVVW